MVDLSVGSAASRGPRGLLDFVAGLKSPSHRDTGPMRGKVPQMQAGVIDTTRWKSLPAGCCSGRRTTNAR